MGIAHNTLFKIMRDTVMKPEIAICYVKVSKLSLPLNELTSFYLNHLHYRVCKKKKKEREKEGKKENGTKKEGTQSLYKNQSDSETKRKYDYTKKSDREKERKTERKKKKEKSKKERKKEKRVMERKN